MGRTEEGAEGTYTEMETEGHSGPLQGPALCRNAAGAINLLLP